MSLPASPAEPGRSITPDEAAGLVTLAGRAPSLHNSQPWSFALVDGRLRLRRDPGRALPATDPLGRELVISCGAALHTLVVGVHAAGHRAEVHRWPDPADPDLVAVVGFGEPLAAGPAERAAAAAAVRRHSHRGGFDAEPVGAPVLVALEAAAAENGARLAIVDHAGHRRRLAGLAREAERALRAEPAVRAELAAWTRSPGDPRRDGVPATAFPAHADEPEPAEFPGRDFDLGRGWGQLAPPPEGATTLAVLLTPGDAVADWLRAGEALQAVLLRAAEDWVFAAPQTAALERPHTRRLIAEELELDGFPQMLLVFGRAGSAPTTPRRPLAEVLEPEAGAGGEPAGDQGP